MIRLFKHYVPHTVLLIGLIDFALLIGAALALSAQAQPSTSCTLTLTPDRVQGISYHATLHVAPSCPPGAAFRVRKSSTLNTVRKGAPYQPIKPDGSPAYERLFSWTVSRAGSNIPRAEEWTSLTWEWQWYHPELWNARAGGYGLWQRIPVRGAP